MHFMKESQLPRCILSLYISTLHNTSDNRFVFNVESHVMFWNRLRKTDQLVECIVIFNANNKTGDPVLEYVYPSAYNKNICLNKLRNFVLPCKHKNLVSEEYTLIFTDSNGNVEFYACIYLPISKYIACISSYLPYFELQHSLLTLINQEHLYRKENRHNIEIIVKRMYQRCGTATLDLSLLSSSSPLNSVRLDVSLPDAQTQFFYHRHILEYYNTLSIGNWIVIFESLLLEKSVIFYSSRLQRVTSCLLASLSLLYPLMWPHLIYSLLPSNCIDYVGCPTPFVAGVHSCLTEKMKPMLVPGVRLVDLDHDIVYGTGDVVTTMPSILRHWLIRRCNASHSAILQHIRSTENVASTAALLLVRPYLELMAILLGGYRSALQHNETSSSVNLLPIQESNDNCRTQIKFDQPRIGGWFFDRAAFVISCGRELQPYLTELLNSQMVIQFLESRVAVLNSDLGIIPSDDFEDIIDHVSVPKRSGGLNDLFNFSRSGFDKITKKPTKINCILTTKLLSFTSVLQPLIYLNIGAVTTSFLNNITAYWNIHKLLSGKSEKLSQKENKSKKTFTELFNRPNNLYQTFKLNGASMNKQDFNQSPVSKVYVKDPHILSVPPQTSRQDICEILRKQLDFKEDNKNMIIPDYREKNIEEKSISQNHSLWQPLSPLIDHELRRSERKNRSLLTSILAELPDFSIDPSLSMATLTSSQDDNSQVSIRKSSSDSLGNTPSRRISSKRMGCYVEPSESEFYRDWVTFDSSPPKHHPSTNFVNFIPSSMSANLFHPFPDDSLFTSLSTNTRPVNSDRSQLQQEILDEFDQLSVSRTRKI
ncbi:unnamed protein product [Heterobilharzia americana]|nr:unnamed protein product [Heterobilharzia americana]